MSTINNFSDEHLSAFVDGQLDNAEANRVFEALNRNPELSLRVSELRKLKELVQYAYTHTASAKRHGTAKLNKSRLISSAIAIGLLTVGVATGWYLQHSIFSWSDNELRFEVEKKRGIVVQISENNPAKWDIALINVSNIRKQFPEKSMDIEIVAYGPGLEMFKKNTQFNLRLDDAVKSGVRLLACGNTMVSTHTRREQLNSSVEVVKTGVVEIIQKQEQGYSYIRP